MTLSIDRSQPNFQISEILPSLVICEAVDGDVYRWGNAEAAYPAFIAYIGYSTPEEKDKWLSQLRSFWKIDAANVCYRRSSRVPNYLWELKIKGMRRFSNSHVWNFDYLSESYTYGLDFLRYLIEIRLEEIQYEETIASRIINGGL
jgi:hypothetical protein